MSSSYTPTGLTYHGSVTLPSDGDPAVVASVNAAGFQYLADNTSFLKLLLMSQFNVKNYGAIGNGSTDDTASVQACLDACQAAGGGLVFFPPGPYRVTDVLSVPQNCVLYGVFGQSKIWLDNSTSHFFLLNGSSYSLQVIDLIIDGLTTNSGNIFRTTGSSCSLTITHCTINPSGFLQGRLTVGLTSVFIDGQNCQVVSAYTGASYWVYADQLNLTGGIYTMAPAATFPLVGNSGSSARVLLDGVRFKQTSTLGGLSFVDGSTGRTVATGCAFDVDDSSAGSPTYAFKVNGGQLNTSGCSFEGDTASYEYSVSAAAGSVLQMASGILYDAGTSTTITIPDGIRSIRIISGLSVAPTVKLPNTLYEGQRLDVALFNGGGSNWSGEVAWQKANGTTALTEDTTIFAGLVVGQTFTLSWVVIDISGVLYWMQCGKVAVMV